MSSNLIENDLGIKIGHVLIEKLRPDHPDFDWGYVSLERRAAGSENRSVYSLVVGASGRTGVIELTIDWVKRPGLLCLVYVDASFREAPRERWAGIASINDDTVEIQITRVDHR